MASGIIELGIKMENLKDWENPLDRKDIKRAQELERLGHCCNLQDNEWPNVVIPTYYVSIAKNDILNCFGSPTFGDRRQVELLKAWEYLDLTEDYEYSCRE